MIRVLVNDVSMHHLNCSRRIEIQISRSSFEEQNESVGFDMTVITIRYASNFHILPGLKARDQIIQFKKGKTQPTRTTIWGSR